MAAVGDVDGRYNRRDVDGRQVRLILAKNPASWQESIAIAGESGDALVFHLTARGDFNSKDASLAWDAPLERLGRARRGRHRPPRIRHGPAPRGGRPEREACETRSRGSSRARPGRSP